MTPTALTEAELSLELTTLTEWNVVASEVVGREPTRRTELHRRFEFATFEDAMAFMAAAASKVSAMNHHPRWENAWRTVLVWLCTWDAGCKPSMLDIQLARFLDQLHGTFPAPRRSRR